MYFSYGSNAERTYENSFNTLGRNNRIQTAMPTQFEASRMIGSRLSFQDNMHDASPVSNYYSRYRIFKNDSQWYFFVADQKFLFTLFNNEI